MVALIAVFMLLARSADDSTVTEEEVVAHLASHPDVVAAVGRDAKIYQAGFSGGRGTFGSWHTLGFIARGEKGGAHVSLHFRGFLRADPTFRGVKVTPATGGDLARLESLVAGRVPVSGPAGATQTTSGSPEGGGPSGGT